VGAYAGLRVRWPNIRSCKTGRLGDRLVLRTMMISRRASALPGA
jgi:hypothetical protein